MARNLLSTNTSVDIDTGCPLRFRVHEDDIIDIIAIGERQEFAATFESAALREFVEVANQALAEADARRARAR